MMTSLETRQMKTTFIRCIFQDDDALEAAEKGQMVETITGGVEEKPARTSLASKAKRPLRSAGDKLFGTPNDRR